MGSPIPSDKTTKKFEKSEGRRKAHARKTCWTCGKIDMQLPGSSMKRGREDYNLAVGRNIL